MNMSFVHSFAVFPTCTVYTDFFCWKMSERQPPHRIWRKKSIQWNPRARSAHELGAVGRGAKYICEDWFIFISKIRLDYALACSPWHKSRNYYLLLPVTASHHANSLACIVACASAWRLLLLLWFECTVHDRCEAVEWVLLFIWFLTLAFISPARLHIVNENYSLRLCSASDVRCTKCEYNPIWMRHDIYSRVCDADDTVSRW